MKKIKNNKVLRNKDGKIKYEKKYVAFSQDNPKKLESSCRWCSIKR
jgi:hypothetical protein